MNQSAHPLLDALRAARGGALNEYDSKRIAQACGVPVTREFLAEDADRAAAAAADLGFPVALKACSPDIRHKQDGGLVILDLADEAAVRIAFSQLTARAAGRALDGVLVQPMVRGARELLLGVTRDPVFGPCVTLGMGGIFAEAIRDVSVRMAPVEPADTYDMMDSLKGAALLGPIRGLAPADREALAACLTGLGRLALDNPDVLEVDVNPVIVRADGTLCAVDALVILAERGHAS